MPNARCSRTTSRTAARPGSPRTRGGSPGVGGNASHAWHTPTYGNNLNRSLTLAADIALDGHSQLALEFDDRCAVEAGYDFGHVEYSSNGGMTWSPLYSCSGRTHWQSHRVELPGAVARSPSLRLRFRLQSDPFVGGESWAVDNVHLTAAGPLCRALQEPPEAPIFADGFDP